MRWVNSNKFTLLKAVMLIDKSNKRMRTVEARVRNWDMNPRCKYKKEELILVSIFSSAISVAEDSNLRPRQFLI